MLDYLNTDKNISEISFEESEDHITSNLDLPDHDCGSIMDLRYNITLKKNNILALLSHISQQV